VKLKLYDQVALTQDVPAHGLKTEDVAVLVDFAPAVKGARGCVLEVLNALGDTLAVVVVPESAIAPLHANEILSVRTLAQAS
jgi:hypothetical protein